MVSYKAKFEALNIEEKTGYKCPNCEFELLHKNSELYCSNEKCSFDKTFGDLLQFAIKSYYNLERIN